MFGLQEHGENLMHHFVFGLLFLHVHNKVLDEHLQCMLSSFFFENIHFGGQKEDQNRILMMMMMMMMIFHPLRDNLKRRSMRVLRRKNVR
jgi:ribosome biogenesis protein Tsr3